MDASVDMSAQTLHRRHWHALAAMEPVLRAAHSHRELDSTACAAFFEMQPPPFTYDAEGVAVDAQASLTQLSQSTKSAKPRLGEHGEGLLSQGGTAAPAAGMSARKRVFAFYSQVLQSSECTLLFSLAREKSKREAAAAEAESLRAERDAAREEIVELRERRDELHKACQYLRACLGLAAAQCKDLLETISAGAAHVVPPSENEDSLPSKRRRDEYGHRRLRLPTPALIDSDNTPIRPSTTTTTTNTAAAAVTAAAGGDVNWPCCKIMNDMTQPGASAAVAEKPEANCAAETAPVSFNDRLLAQLEALDASAATAPVNGVVASRPADEASHQCAKCGDETGDLLKCGYCRQFWHEMCGGPHPDDDQAKRLCKGCKVQMGIDSSGDDMSEDSDSRDGESDDTDLSGFIVDSDEDELGDDEGVLLESGSDSSSENGRDGVRATDSSESSSSSCEIVEIAKKRKR